MPQKNAKDAGQEPQVLRDNNEPKSTVSRSSASQSAPKKATATAAKQNDDNAAAMLDLAATLAQGGSTGGSTRGGNPGKTPKTKQPVTKQPVRKSPLDNLYSAGDVDSYVDDGHDDFDTWGVPAPGPMGMMIPYPVYAARGVMGPQGMEDVYSSEYGDDWDPVGEDIDYDQGDGAEDSLGDDVQDAGAEPETVETVDMTGDNDDEGDLLSAYRERYADEEGPPMGDQLARVTNDIWVRGRDPTKVKDIMVKHPRPSNLKCQKVDINPEVLSSIPKPARTRDAKLRAVQNGVARAAVPIVKIAEKVMDKSKPVDRKDIINLTLDSITLLANANGSVNQTRRDALKPNMQSRFQVLCRVPREDESSSLLFGAALTDRIKAASQGGKLGRRGFGCQPQAGYRGRRTIGYHPYGAPTYFRGYGRGQNFLGKSRNSFAQDKLNDEMTMISVQETQINVPYVFPDTNATVAPVFRPTTPGPGPNETDERGSGERGKPLVVPVPQSTPVQVGEYPPELANIDISVWGIDFKAGRVSNCATEWAKITSDRKILSNIRSFKLEFTEPPFQTRAIPELRFSELEKNFLRTEIQSLLKKEVLVKAEHTVGEFVSNVLLREKQEPGNYRMILNLKHLNKFVEKHHFKMETLISTLSLVTPGCRFLSFDFSDAYYSCSVFPPHRKYLRFTFEGQLYEFTCLPNGLISAPRFFTKIMKVALSHLRNKSGITISGYLDDNILVNNDSLQKALTEGTIAAELFQLLGFTINIPKSVVFPTKVIVHLGFIIDSVRMIVTMTEEKTQKILKFVQVVLHHRNPTIRQVARLIGKINATGPANRWAALFTKNMEIEKIRALKCNGFNYDAKMSLSEETKQDLIWVNTHLADSLAPIRCSKPDYVIYTDASNQGWGCYDPQTGSTGGGRWSIQEQRLHINLLELKAILFGVRSLCTNLQGNHVRIMTDNTTALACLNKQGSVKSRSCNKMTRLIWDFAMGQYVWLSAAHCPGALNVEADEASRVFDDKTEWTLRKDIFEILCKHFRKPDIDLFASRLNCQVQRYCSWQPDPGAVYVDSLMYDWSEEAFVYAFPPFSIIYKVIQKWIHDKAHGILVVPFWPTQPWFTLFNQMTCDTPITFDVVTDELMLPFASSESVNQMGQSCTNHSHPLAGRLTMMVGRCHGGHYGNKGLTMMSSTPCCEPDGTPQIDSTNHTWISGKYFVTRQGQTRSLHLSLRHWNFYIICVVRTLREVIVQSVRLDQP